jgi:hypothetical protein
MVTDCSTICSVARLSTAFVWFIGNRAPKLGYGRWRARLWTWDCGVGCPRDATGMATRWRDVGGQIGERLAMGPAGGSGQVRWRGIS